MKISEFKNSDDWRDYCIHQLTSCKNHEFAIVKGHILSEYLLTHFIELSNTKESFNSTALQFGQKLKVYQVFCSTCLVAPALKLLNKMRNSISHSLKVDEEDLKTFIKIGEKFNNPNDPLDPKFSKEIVQTCNSLLTIISHLFAEIESHFQLNEGIKEFREENAKKLIWNMPYNQIREGLTPLEFRVLQERLSKEMLGKKEN